MPEMNPSASQCKKGIIHLATTLGEAPKPDTNIMTDILSSYPCADNLGELNIFTSFLYCWDS